MPSEPSPQVADALRAVGEKYNIPLWFLYSVAKRESSFDPNATNNWDSESGSGFPGRGLFQITGQDSANPQFAAYSGASNDLGFNKFGQWVNPATVPYMSNIYDPYQNTERFASSFAGPWFNYMKGQHPDWDVNKVWEAVAYNWNHGLFNTYDPNETGYLNQFRDYANQYMQQFGGSSAGDPYSRAAGTSPYMYGPSAGAGLTAGQYLGGSPLGRDLFPNMGQTPMTSSYGRNMFQSGVFPGLFGGSSLGATMTGTGSMFGGSSLGQSFGRLGDMYGGSSLGQSIAPGSTYRGTGSTWLDYYNKVFGY